MSLVYFPRLLRHVCRHGHRQCSTSTVPITGSVGGVPVIDSEAWWRSVRHEPVRAKLRALLRGAGVEFWDGSSSSSDSNSGNGECNYVKAPSVALSAIGGIPLRLPAPSTSSVAAAAAAASGEGGDGAIELAIGSPGPQVQLSQVADALRVQMGMAGFPSYLNPHGVEAAAMFDTCAEHGHFSVAHTASLSFVIAGHSCAVENELNCQRDVVHVARLTVARTAAQADPPIVVPFAELVPMYRSIREHSAQQLAELPPRKSLGCTPLPSVGDWQEARFTAWPAAKAQLAVVTGSLRNLQKLVGDLGATGKEAEYLTLLAGINNALAALLPDMFERHDGSSAQ